VEVDVVVGEDASRASMRRCARSTPAAQRRSAARDGILSAARELIADEGFTRTQISLIAVHAGVGVGSIYQHFPSRAELFAEIYRDVASHEFDIVEKAVAASTGGPDTRIAVAIATFCTRALRAGRFAYALLVEPVEPAVDEHRLAFREGYRRLFARLLAEAVELAELPPQDVQVSAAAVLGIMTETLVRPLGDRGRGADTDELVQKVVGLCLAAVGAARSRRGRWEP